MTRRKKTHAEYVQQCTLKGFDLPIDSEDNRYDGVKVHLLHRCDQDHDYPQTPGHHLNGHGCPQCHGTPLKTHAQYVQECILKHLDLPINSEDNQYSGRKNHLLHRCNRGHDYSQTPNGHLRGDGCPECYGTPLKTHAQYVQECTLNGFDLPVDNEDNRYSAAHGHLLHRCKQDHDYPQTPHNHLKGQGCPICNGGILKLHSEYV